MGKAESLDVFEKENNRHVKYPISNIYLLYIISLQVKKLVVCQKHDS